MISERMINKVRPETAEEQFGFLANSGTNDVLFTLNRISKNAIHARKDVNVCFVDYERPFKKSSIMN